jgi:hypothetical protein
MQWKLQRMASWLRRRGGRFDMAPSRPACALACALVLAGACQRDPGIETFGADTGTAGHPASVGRLETAVRRAYMTDRIVTSTMERKEAAPGNTFVVLDVSVRNAGTQPQVFSEGKLIDAQGARERTFATPLTMLTDEFLSLQVVPPGAHVRGKIAYEVPDDLAGALYWSPGSGGQRIALRPVRPTVAVATLGNAEADGEMALETGGKSEHDRSAPTPARVPPPSPRRDIAAAVQPAESADDARARAVAVTEVPPAEAAPRSNEPARTLACQALLTRNDPAEKAAYLGFFARQCPDYEMPSTWRSATAASIPPATASVPVPRWPPRSGPAFDCNQAWTRAEHLVCEDAVLSLMDWELNRAYAGARRAVGDPAALQREEDDWRHRVRDACDTRRCIEAAYELRTAQLEAMARAR